MVTWGEYVDFEDQRDAEFLRTTLKEQKKPKEKKKKQSTGRECFRRVCSTNSSAAGFQEIYGHWIWQPF